MNGPSRQREVEFLRPLPRVAAWCAVAVVCLGFWLLLAWCVAVLL